MLVVWADSARSDFDRAIAFLEQHSPAAADRIGQRILDVVSLLEEFPDSRRPRSIAGCVSLR